MRDACGRPPPRRPMPAWRAWSSPRVRPALPGGLACADLRTVDRAGAARLRRRDDGGAAAGTGLAEGVGGDRTASGRAGLGRRRRSVPVGGRRTRWRSRRNRSHRRDARAAPSPARRRARCRSRARHRCAASAANDQGRRRDRRTAQGRRGDRPRARPRAGVSGARPYRGRRGRRHRASHCRRRTFGGRVHHRRLRAARRRPAPRVLRP